ncbi:MAG: hypothetical protein Q9224_002002 [Gallowayella concinna]
MDGINYSAFLRTSDHSDTDGQRSSWKTTYIGLTELEFAPADISLERHLTDSQTIDLLKSSLLPSSPPTSQSKSMFETKTSAINVAASPQSRYDVKQIQDDTLWLSAKAAVDEVTALRIVILEWQTRPASRLQHSSPPDDTPASGGPFNGSRFQPALSASRSTYLFRPQSDGVMPVEKMIGEDGRRKQLVSIYLAELLYKLKTCSYLIGTAFSRTKDGRIVSSQPSGFIPRWVEEVGSDIIHSWDVTGVSQVTGKNVLISGVDAFRSRIRKLEEGCGWFPNHDFNEPVEVDCCQSQILEMMVILDIMLVILGILDRLPRADVVISWFRLMTDYGFFEVFEPVSQISQSQFSETDPEQPFRESYDAHELEIQSLCSLVSLAILRVPNAMKAFEPPSDTTIPDKPQMEDTAYMRSISTCCELTDVLLKAASQCLQVASPAILAWSVILQALRERSFAALAEKEDRANGRLESADSPEGQNPEPTSMRSIGSSLRRGSSTGSDTPQHQTFLEQLLHDILLVAVEGDPIAYLARAAVDGSHVLNIIATLSLSCCTPIDSDHGIESSLRRRRILMDLIQSVLGLIDYQPDLVAATLAVLSGNDNDWAMYRRPREFREIEPAALFLSETHFMTKIFDVARSRFPFELLPFIRLCRALAVSHAKQEEGLPAIWPSLVTTDCLTCVLPTSFTDYQLEPDDEDSNIISLTANLSIFDNGHTLQSTRYKRMKPSGSPVSAQSFNLRRIPRGAMGRALTETKPLVVLWHHDYCPLAYMGMLLGSASSIEPRLGDNPQSNGLSFEAVAATIDLLTVILLTAVRSTLAPEASLSTYDVAQNILDTASEGLDQGQDIVSVVFDIFEKELGRQPKTTDEAPLSVLVHCAHFAEALLHVMPDRVWPFLGRSSLLGIKDSDSQLSAVLASTEMAVGRHDLLLACLHLFESLVNDALSHAVLRKGPVKGVTRFNSPALPSTGVSEVVTKKVLFSFQRIMLDVYENFSTWNYVQMEQRLEIGARLSSLFNKLLTTCYGIEDQLDASQKLCASLLPAVEQIVKVFLSSSCAESTLAYLTSAIQEGVGEAKRMQPQNSGHGMKQTISVLGLATTLLRLNTLLGYGCSRLEAMMLKHVSLLVQCYTSHPLFRQPTVELLVVLVRNADLTEGQPSSLLGHMGEDAANHFLEVLAMIDEPLCDRDLSVSIWKLLSAVVSKRQQWFAISILTGEAPRELIKKKTSEFDDQDRRKSILNVALDRLSNIGRLHAQTALAMLEFVALAADSWPWILSICEQHPSFLSAVTEYISQVETVSNTTQNRSSQSGMEYYKLQITSFITDILAMYTRRIRQSTQTSYAKELLPSLSYVITAAVLPPEYNASLHSNLRKNFEATFGNCKLTAFKRTCLEPSSLGESFYYDLEIASEMLCSDPSWGGRDRAGFGSELARANVNLSIVEARISLFESWRSLAVELSQSLETDIEYQKTMAEVTMNCLRANAQTTLPQAIFERLAQSRADLAFTLVQRLIGAQSSRPEVKTVLFTAWDAIRAHGTDLAVVLDGDRAPYCRTLLKILCLALQAHTSSRSFPGSTDQRTTQDDDPQQRPSAANATLGTVLEILRTVVAYGFRSLTTLLHDSSDRVFPNDFALLAAILRNSLRIPGLERHTTALLSSFADAQTSRYASTLLSWSDQLATNRDPVYGELSVNFLLEMSSLPALAEVLAVEGILNHISNTNLIKHLRKSRGMGPFEQPVRLYNIWVRGILPLLLNLLHAVGATMAAEVSNALNQFLGQLARASATFTYYGKVPVMNGSDTNSAGYVTLSMISEAQTLAVITTMLDTYREAGPSAGVVSSEIVEIGWDRTRVKEDVETWLQTRPILRERIVPIGEREERWMRMKSGGHGASGASSKLEEKVVEDLELLFTLLGGKED